LDRGGHVEARLDPARTCYPDRVGVVLDPLERDDHRARAESAQLGRPVEPERDDRVVHRDARDRQLLPLRVRDPDPDLVRLELDAADVELVGGRRLPADEVQQRGTRRGEERDHADEQQERQERPEAPRHQSTTSKNPIQPSSVNSVWWAWNMKRPVLAKSISTIPRCPWHSITVSVYSK